MIAVILCILAWGLFTNGILPLWTAITVSVITTIILVVELIGFFLPDIDYFYISRR